MNTFKQNQELTARSIGDSECIFRATVTKRTKKTININIDDDEKRCKIHTDSEGSEYIYPFGKYSMCAIFRA